jgi:NAD(P)-dependent dehydrogenase (short-subunit alcohol dehydrogenase family)
MAPLNGKTVLIVGGSSGIGFGIAKVALADGATVIIASSTSDKVQVARERLGGGERVRGEVIDVRHEKAIAAFLERLGKVDHLVYTVGSAIYR